MGQLDLRVRWRSLANPLPMTLNCKIIINMNKHISFVLLLVLLLITVSCKSELMDNNSSSILVSQSMSFRSRINGDEFSINVSDKIFNKSTEWNPDQPLPLSTAEAVAIAQNEIQKHDSKGGIWEVTSINLQRLSKGKWIYAIHFDPANGKSMAPPSNNYIVIPILFNGKPVERTK